MVRNMFATVLMNITTIWRPGLIGAIRRQFSHMVTHVFDNSNLSKEIFAIDTWGAVICSLGYDGKHMLRPGFH